MRNECCPSRARIRARLSGPLHPGVVADRRDVTLGSRLGVASDASRDTGLAMLDVAESFVLARAAAIGGAFVKPSKL